MFYPLVFVDTQHQRPNVPDVPVGAQLASVTFEHLGAVPPSPADIVAWLGELPFLVVFLKTLQLKPALELSPIAAQIAERSAR